MDEHGSAFSSSGSVLYSPRRVCLLDCIGVSVLSLLPRAAQDRESDCLEMAHVSASKREREVVVPLKPKGGSSVCQTRCRFITNRVLNAPNIDCNRFGNALRCGT
jgi:hypothetical protein